MLFLSEIEYWWNSGALILVMSIHSGILVYIDAFVKLKLLPEFSLQMINIIFGYFGSDSTKENISFIINVIIFLSKFFYP